MLPLFLQEKLLYILPSASPKVANCPQLSDLDIEFGPAGSDMILQQRKLRRAGGAEMGESLQQAAKGPAFQPGHWKKLAYDPNFYQFTASSPLKRVEAITGE